MNTTRQTGKENGDERNRRKERKGKRESDKGRLISVSEMHVN